LWKTASCTTKGDLVQTYSDPRADAPADIWAGASANLKQEVSEGNFHAWFGRTRALALDGDTLVLAVPSSFAKQWIEARYLDPLRRAVAGAAGRSLDVALLPADDDGAADPIPDIALDAQKAGGAADEETPAPRSPFHPK
jgi:chromosomal replication initiation ATPase DnaA